MLFLGVVLSLTFFLFCPFFFLLPLLLFLPQLASFIKVLYVKKIKLDLID